MKTASFVSSAMVFGVAISLTLGVQATNAQGPAGAGAAAAAQETSHNAESLNPMKLFRKDARNSNESGENRGEIEARLTPRLQTEQLLPTSTTAAEACQPYTELSECLASLHASHSLGVDFYCLRAVVTGVNTTADVSGCGVGDQDKALDLAKAIHQLKPDANAKRAAKDAEQEAVDELRGVGE